MEMRMNTITNLEFYFFSPQRLMNVGGTCNAGRRARVSTPATPCLSGFWKLLPIFDVVFMERFRVALILYKNMAESVAGK